MSFEIPVNRIVIATHNRGKLGEFADLLAGVAPEIVSAGELGLPSPEETGATFAENALLKARAAATASGSLALADDSGLCVTALGGRPGIFSARWAEKGAEPGKEFDSAMRRIRSELAALGDDADRSACFICALALYWPEGMCEVIEGRIDGTIARVAKGAHGHGYDPIFIPEGFTTTFAEMNAAEKNRISHRGKASQALLERFGLRRNRQVLPTPPSLP
jgi:XTP/dITP diphosphohydrolase